MASEWLEKMRSIGAISHRSGDRVQEGRDEGGRRFKATTDEFGNTVTQRHDDKHGEAQDVHIRAPRIVAETRTSEERD